MAIARYHAAACQVDQPNPRHRGEIRRNTDRLVEMARCAALGYSPFFRVRLVVFPEFALAAPIYPTAEELWERLALPLENEHLERLQGLARELGILIQTGSFLETDARWPDAIFNTTVLLGPEGTLLRYRKVHPWIPWEVHASPHDLEGYEEPLFPVAETELGRLGVATCYDWLFPETTRELALGGAEVLIRISAYMDPWGATAPMDWWTVVNRCRAIENQAAVVACNQGASLAHYPPFSWPGGSMIVDHDGRILAQADPGAGEKIVVGPIDLAGLRAARRERVGHALLAHRRVEAYRRQREPAHRAAPGARERRIEALRERTASELLQRFPPPPLESP
jgi:predicted amidohydrolase